MDISSLYSYNAMFSMVNALYPTTSVSSVSGIPGLSTASNVLSLTGVGADISSVGSLMNGVETLQAASKSLMALKGFDARKVATSDAKVASASAGAGTALGTYAVEVSQLAQAQSLTTGPQASSLSRIGSGAATLTFGFANGETREVSLAGTDNTLGRIASAINAAGIGVKAQVAESPSGYRLSLTGQSGAANAFTIDVAGNAAVGDLLAYPAGGGGGPTLTAQARNAEGLLDGAAFVSGTNTVSTAIEGLTLSLASTGKASLTVAPDTELTKTVGSFVEAYNAVQTTLNTLGTENTTLGWSVSYLRSQLTDALGDDASLARIGIATQSDGTLSINAQAFNAALSATPEKVASLLSSDATGLAGRVASLTEGSLSPTNLLQYALPSANYSAGLLGTSDQGWEYLYLSQLGVLDTGSRSPSFSSLLFNELLNANLSSPSGASSSNQFLLSFLDQQAANERLLSATFG